MSISISQKQTEEAELRSCPRKGSQARSKIYDRSVWLDSLMAVWYMNYSVIQLN